MNLDDIQKHIETNNAVMLYFSGEDCGVCKVLQPKVETLFNKEFPKINQIYVSASSHKDIAAHFGIFTVPSLIVFLDSKEFIKESRNISLLKLEEQLKRPYNLFFS